MLGLRSELSVAPLSQLFTCARISAISAITDAEMRSLTWKNCAPRAIPTLKYLGASQLLPGNRLFFEQFVNSFKRQKICSTSPFDERARGGAFSPGRLSQLPACQLAGEVVAAAFWGDL